MIVRNFWWPIPCDFPKWDGHWQHTNRCTLIWWKQTTICLKRETEFIWYDGKRLKDYRYVTRRWRIPSCIQISQVRGIGMITSPQRVKWIPVYNEIDRRGKRRRSDISESCVMRRLGRLLSPPAHAGVAFAHVTFSCPCWCHLPCLDPAFTYCLLLSPALATICPGEFEMLVHLVSFALARHIPVRNKKKTRRCISKMVMPSISRLLWFFFYWGLPHFITHSLPSPTFLLTIIIADCYAAFSAQLHPCRRHWILIQLYIVCRTDEAWLWACVTSGLVWVIILPQDDMTVYRGSIICCALADILILLHCISR